MHSLIVKSVSEERNVPLVSAGSALGRPVCLLLIQNYYLCNKCQSISLMETKVNTPSDLGIIEFRNMARQCVTHFSFN